MQVGVDVTYMHIKFGGVAFLVSKILIQWTIVHGHQKFNQLELTKKIHAIRD